MKKSSQVFGYRNTAITPWPDLSGSVAAAEAGAAWLRYPRAPGSLRTTAQVDAARTAVAAAAASITARQPKASAASRSGTPAVTAPRIPAISPMPEIIEK